MSNLPKRRLDNWLLTYQEYTKGTESPALYHLWVGLSAICASAQRKIYMEHDYFKTHTNMYVVLVGPSGVRKSTAIKLGKDLLLGVEDYGHKIHFSTNASSAAALVQQLIKIGNPDHQSLTAASTELGSLIRVSDSDIVGFLTDIYDCEPGWDKQTVGRGLELIEHPWLNLIGATTPDWMKDNLDKLSIEGGFVRRVLFVYADQHELIAFPEMTDEQKKMRQSLIHDLSVIAEIEGKFTFADAVAKEFYKDWYEDKTRFHGIPSALKSYHECKADHIRKVAMSISLSEGNSLKISKLHLEAAIGLLGEIESGMTKILTSVGKNPLNTDLDRINDQIKNARKITYKKLFTMNVYALEKRQFDEVLSTLVELGQVVAKGGTLYHFTALDTEEDDS